MIIDGNVDYKGVLVGSSASISSMNAIQGISVGANSIGSGAITFQDTQSVAFGMSGSTITASRDGQAALGVHFPGAGAFGYYLTSMNSGTTGTTGGSFQTTVSMFCAPMVIPYNISLNQVIIGASASTVGGTGSLTEGYMVGLYSLNANTALSLISNWRWEARRSQNSSTAQSHYWYWGTDSAANSSSTGQAGGSISTRFTGHAMLLLATTQATLAGSEYYAVVGYTVRESSTPMGRGNQMLLYSGSQTTLGNFIGTSQLYYYANFGVFTTTSNGTTTGMLMPTSIHTSVITTSGGSSLWRVPFIHFRAT